MGHFSIPVQSDLEQFIIFDRSVSHHHSIVELIKRSLSLRSSVVVQQLDQAPVSLMEPDLVVVEVVQSCS